MTAAIETLSRAEAARYLGISVSLLDRLRQRKVLTPTTIGRRVLYRRSILDRFLDRRTR